MINELTKKQKLQKEVIKEYWINKALYSGPDIDKEKVESYMSYIYSKFQKEKPRFVCLKSPLAIQYFLNLIQIAKNRKTKYREVRNEVWNEVRNEVENEVRNEVENEVGNEVWNEVENEVRSKKLKFYSFKWYDLSDVGWVSYYDFFLKNTDIFSQKTKQSFERYLEHLDSGIFMSVATNKYFVYCKRPTKVLKNNRGLHSENSPAIVFEDGYSFHSLHGIRLKKDLWKKIISTRMSFQEILKIENTEQRLIAMRYNPNALMNENPKLIKKSERGNELWLIENSEVNKIYDAPKVYLLGFEDPSKTAPNNKFYEEVDPELAEKNPDPDFINASHSKMTLAQYNDKDLIET